MWPGPRPLKGGDASVPGDMMRLSLQVLEKLQTGFSCWYKKRLPLLGLRSEVGVTFLGAGS